MSARPRRRRRPAIVETSGGTKCLDLRQRNAAYFLAQSGMDLEASSMRFLQDKWILVALNYLISGGSAVSQERLAQIRALCDEGKYLYVDSGGFTLAAQEAERRGISVPDTFMLSPSELPFFDKWYDVYIACLRHLKDIVWGMVEIDFGSLAERAETRARIKEDTGFNAIPVFRFGKDPIEGLDELVATHDRVCLAGLAKQTPAFRSAALSLLFYRCHEINPACWLHVLGVSAVSAFTSSGLHSCDASTFTNYSRYGLTCGYTYSGFSNHFDWAPKPPRPVTTGEHTTFTVDMGRFQHSTLNLGRTAYLEEANSLLIP